MYSQTGVLLLSQLLHNEKVERLKCRTYAPPRFLGLAETHDELLIMYTRAIVSIDGFSLIQSLRACCNQVARATASGTENMLQPPPLAYKKWSLGEQDKVSDYVACGVVCTNPFDQLKAASMLGGVKATVKTSPPAMNVFMTAGTGPYVGFFYAIEGFTQPILSEVAIAMANKIKSALLSAASGWLGFGGKAKEEKEKPPKIEPAAPLPLRFGLPDRRRAGDVIMLSPCNNYAATTDSFGRVILVDVQRGMAVRMWKGYRDAQVGWIEVKEENAEREKNPDHYRLAQFLIIYAPRRGILEVWLAAHGPRVAAFNVSKYCCLVCPCYGMLGLNNVTSRGIKSRTFQCALIDPSGVIKTVDIPFHLALSDKSSKRARDLHLLKKLKTYLKESTEDTEGLEETIRDLLLDMKIASIAHQGIERILSTKYLPVSLMQNLVKACIKRLDSRMEDNLDLDSRIMLKFCRSQRSLLSLYSSVTTLNSAEVETNKLSDCEILTSVLRLTLLEAQAVLTLLEHYDLLTLTSNLPKQPARVKFKDDMEPLGATSFLHSFSYRTLFSNEDSSGSGSPTTTSASSSKQMQITVSKEASEERKLALGKFLFSGCLNGQCQVPELLAVIQKSNLPPDQLMSLLLLYWLSSLNHTVAMMANFYELVKTITALTDLSEVVVESNERSTWWQRVRNLCSQSDNIRAAYLAVVTCRAVAVHALGLNGPFKDPDADTLSGKSEEDEEDSEQKELKPVKSKDKKVSKDVKSNEGEDGNNPSTSVADTSADSQEWESLTVDMELWEVLVRQCEDALAIVTLLNIQTGSEDRQNQPPIVVSVARLLLGGKGSIPEVVARYVVQQHLNPASLFFSFTTEENNEEEEEEEQKESSSVEEEVDSEESQVEKKQEKKRLKGGSPQKKANKESERPLAERVQEMSQSDKVKYQLDELRKRFPHNLHNDFLLSNCCWEYAVLWNKEPEETWNLELSLEFLRLVQNAILRQGVSSLLWHMFMKKRSSSAAHLMEKVAKTPKDRLCRKEVGMSDSSLGSFISLCADFMEIIMDANCEAHEVPVYNLEPAWQKVEGPTSLVELAVDQKATNYGLLRLHFHLLKIMSAVLALGIKPVKVLSLFDNKGRAALFKELHAHPLLPNQKVEPALITARKNFLCQVISASVATIEPPSGLDQSVTSVISGASMSSAAQFKRQRSLYPAAFKWPQVVQMLARDFGLDLDFFKRHHVCELYSYGHDKLGEEVMLSVNDHEEMGVQLLTVGGQRIAWEIFKRDIDRNFQHLAGMSTSLTRWLKDLDPECLHFPGMPLSTTELLLEQAATRLTEDSRHHNLAQELLEKTRTLAQFTSSDSRS
ncbi:rab3 GTPase-activating protein non-catalytic subunit-like [Elysia marginata]|uniref:Rab3 GTPase-activating protein non-catalytic subunit-like n=1 Tax=Elysia marginata TaxID=1093978 RepID=A0AAV4I0I8_9GAST|nr:rab3 GTPase-activating protein non-catalytic subunit-like [Elysia marginata]